MTLRRFSSAKKFFGETVRIYSGGDSNVTSGAAVPVIRNKEIATVNVASVIATVHISDCNCRVESKRDTIPSKYREMIAGVRDAFTGRVWTLRALLK
jgi:hypothetical protein